jgi:hypothetical protein
LQIDAEAAWKTWCIPSGQVSCVLFAHQLMNVFVVTCRIITAEMAFPDSHEESNENPTSLGGGRSARATRTLHLISSTKFITYRTIGQSTVVQVPDQRF